MAMVGGPVPLVTIMGSAKIQATKKERSKVGAQRAANIILLTIVPTSMTSR